MQAFDYQGCEDIADFYRRGSEECRKIRGRDYTLYLEKISELAADCASYKEFGTFQGLSAAAAILGNPLLQVSLVDLSFDLFRPNASLFPEVEIWEGDSLLAPAGPCDLLFIDSRHNARTIRRELERHGPSARKFIMAHDTAHIRQMRDPLDEFALSAGASIIHDDRSVGYSLITL